MSERKKILFVIPTLRIGGAEKALVSLLNAMDPDRYQVDLFLFEQGGTLQKDVPNWVNVLPENPITRAMMLEFRRYFKDLLRSGKIAAAGARMKISVRSSLRSRFHKRRLFSWKSISKHVEPLRGQYDVAIAFLEYVTSFFVMDKVTADRKVLWVHSDYTGAVFLPEEASYYARYGQIVTITPKCKAALETAIPAVKGRVEVIENFVLPEEVRAKADEALPIPWDPEQKHLITVGRLEDIKGIDLAIRACGVLREKGRPVCWHVFGDGSKKEALTKLIEELSLQDCFFLEGSVPNPFPYLKAADIFVQPSRQEGKSIALDEAKILGKPIVVTNYSSVEDQIRHEITGIITKKQPEAIAEGIDLLLSDPEKRAALGRNCRSLPSVHETILARLYRLLETDGSDDMEEQS